MDRLSSQLDVLASESGDTDTTLVADLVKQKDSLALEIESARSELQANSVVLHQTAIAAVTIFQDVARSKVTSMSNREIALGSR